MNEETLKKALTEVLEDRRRIDQDTHSTHHEYVSRLIERDKRRSEMWSRVRGHVIGWGIITSVTGLVYLLGDATRELLRNWLKTKGGV